MVIVRHGKRRGNPISSVWHAEPFTGCGLPKLGAVLCHADRIGYSFSIERLVPSPRSGFFSGCLHFDFPEYDGLLVRRCATRWYDGLEVRRTTALTVRRTSSPSPRRVLTRASFAIDTCFTISRTNQTNWTHPNLRKPSPHSGARLFSRELRSLVFVDRGGLNASSFAPFVPDQEGIRFPASVADKQQ